MGALSSPILLSVLVGVIVINLRRSERPAKRMFAARRLDHHGVIPQRFEKATLYNAPLSLLT